MTCTADTPDVEVPTPHNHRRRLAAVVLNHRTAGETRRAAASLMASTRRPDHLIVVDNDVPDECRAHFEDQGSAEAAHCAGAQGPEVTYLHTGQNLGFSGGMNMGIRAALGAGAEIVLLVNSDIVVSAECVERLESMLTVDPGAAIAGPLVLSHAQPDRVASAGIRYDRRSGRMRELGVGTNSANASRASRDVDAVSGCLIMVARRVFEQVGLLDERFFFGFEDLDFCLRARAAGFSTVLVGNATAFHEGGRSIGRSSSRRWYFGARNHLLVAGRHAPGEAPGMRVFRVSWVVALSLAHAMTADAGSLPGRLAATFRGVRDYCGGHYGPDPAA